jgi:hypothetical protein
MDEDQSNLRKHRPDESQDDDGLLLYSCRLSNVTITKIK